MIGLEPTSLAAEDFKSPVFTSFTTLAKKFVGYGVPTQAYCVLAAHWWVVPPAFFTLSAFQLYRVSCLRNWSKGVGFDTHILEVQSSGSKLELTPAEYMRKDTNLRALFTARSVWNPALNLVTIKPLWHSCEIDAPLTQLRFGILTADALNSAHGTTCPPNIRKLFTDKTRSLRPYYRLKDVLARAH